MHKYHPIRRGAAHLRLSGFVVSGEKLQAIVAAISSNDRIDNKRNYGYICGRNAAIDVARRAAAHKRMRQKQNDLYDEFRTVQGDFEAAQVAIEKAMHLALQRAADSAMSAVRLKGIRKQLAVLRLVTLEGVTYKTRGSRYRDMSRDLWDQNRRRGALLIMQDLPPAALSYLTLWRGIESAQARKTTQLDRLQKRLTV